LNIQFNGAPLEIEGLTPQTTFGELLETVEESLKQEGLTLTEIVLNGKAHEPDDVTDFEKKALDSFSSIEFMGATLREILEDALETSEEAITHIHGLATKISSQLRLGNTQETMEQHLEFLDCLSWLAAVIENMGQSYAKNLQESGLEHRRTQLQAKFQEQLACLQAAQENQDWVGMADILEYELPELFNESLSIVQAVRSV
jgi:hypothetical protein